MTAAAVRNNYGMGHPAHWFIFKTGLRIDMFRICTLILPTEFILNKLIGSLAIHGTNRIHTEQITMNIGLLVIVIVPLSLLIITPEIRRRRQNNVNNNNNNNEIIVNNDVDVDNNSYNIGKWIGNVISIVIIFSILIVIRLLYSNLSLISSSLTKSKLLSTCPPVGINLIGAYGNMQGLNDIRNITSRKPETQILYKQGLLHLYGFNFEEANRNMLAAVDIENDCIMCYCGLAYSYGPNINLGVYPDAALKGRLAIQKALNLIIKYLKKKKN